MSIVYTSIPISTMKNSPAAVIQQVKNAPVILTQRGESAAIVASLDVWNDRERELRRLQRLIRIKEALLQNDFVGSEEVDTTFAAMGID